MDINELNTEMKVPVDTLFLKMGRVAKKVRKNNYKGYAEIYSSKPYAKYADMSNDERVTKEYYSEMNFIKVITDWNNYYMMGNGIDIELKDKPELEEVYRKTLDRISFEDMVINYAGLDAAKFGTGFLYLFTKENGDLGLTWLSPFSTWVEYQYSTREPIYAFRFWEEEDLINPRKKIQCIEYYDNEKIVTARKDSMDNITTTVREHCFGVVPVIEFMHNKDRDVESCSIYKNNQLINQLLSKYNEKLGRVSAETTVFDNIEFQSKEALELYKKKGILMTKPGQDADGKAVNGSVQYVQNTIPNGFIETIDSIRTAMYKTTATPDFSDSNVYTQASGVALKMLLTPADIKAKPRTELFKRAIYRLLQGVKNYLIVKDFSKSIPFLEETAVEDITISFSAISFKDIMDKKDMLTFMNDSGKFSTETIIKEAGIRDAKAEMERKSKEDEDLFTGYSVANRDVDINENITE